METDVILAALNDKYSLNSNQVIEIFREADKKEALENIELSTFKEFLKGKSLSEGDIRKYSDVLEMISQSDLDFYHTYLRNLQDKDIEFINVFKNKYPYRLRDIDKPPLGLYVDGDLSCWKNGVAVVGTREAHEHRIEFVEKIGSKLVEMNMTVVSGLANGVDEAAHQSALDAGGKTIGVLPGHVEKIYPKSNQPIGESIPENGALVSEVSEKVSINRGRFVERNRITSGLSRAVIIGASRDTGGTIRQAEFAQSQNVPILLYDPEEDDGQSPDELKEMGAKTFNTLEELETLLNSIGQTNHSGKNYTLREYTG